MKGFLATLLGLAFVHPDTAMAAKPDCGPTFDDATQAPTVRVTRTPEFQVGRVRIQATTVPDAPVWGAEAARLTKEIDEMLIGTQLKPIENPQVVLSRTAEFDANGNPVSDGATFTDATVHWVPHGTPGGSHPDFAHEYGHLVLDQYLRPKVAQNANVQRIGQNQELLLQKVNEKKRQVVARISVLKGTPAHYGPSKRALSPAEKVELESLLVQRDRLQARVIALNDELSGVLARNYSPYHELFADLIAVLHSNDAVAMKKVIESKFGIPSASRSFSSDGAPAAPSMHDHDILAAARVWIGKNGLRPGMSPQERARLIDAVANIAVEETIYWARNPGTSNVSGRTPESVNRRVIEKLELRLREPRSPAAPGSGPTP